MLFEINIIGFEKISTDLSQKPADIKNRQDLCIPLIVTLKTKKQIRTRVTNKNQNNS